MKHGLVVPLVGRPFVVEINGLKDMQMAVDGLIQPVDCDKFDIYLNEEGLLREMKLNIGITKMIQSMMSQSLLKDRTAHELFYDMENTKENGKMISDLVSIAAEPYVGDALIMGKIDENGETTSLKRSDLSGWVVEWLGDPKCVICEEEEPNFDAKIVWEKQARWGQFCAICYATLESLVRKRLLDLNNKVQDDNKDATGPEDVVNKNFTEFVEALLNVPQLGTGNGQILADPKELEKLEV